MHKVAEEKDLFRLMVVNSYGYQVIKRLVDDPKRPLQLSGTCTCCSKNVTCVHIMCCLSQNYQLYSI